MIEIETLKWFELSQSQMTTAVNNLSACDLFVRERCLALFGTVWWHVTFNRPRHSPQVGSAVFVNAFVLKMSYWQYR